MNPLLGQVNLTPLRSIAGVEASGCIIRYWSEHDLRVQFRNVAMNVTSALLMRALRRIPYCKGFPGRRNLKDDHASGL